MTKHIKKHFWWAKYIVKRLLGLRKRTKLVVIAAIIINSVFVLQLYANFFVYPNTYLGDTNISGKTRAQVTAILDTWMHLSYHVRIKDRQYSYSYTDLGIITNVDETLATIFAPNTHFPASIISLMQALTTPRVVAPTVNFTQQFAQFIHDSVFDFSDGAADYVLFDEKDKTLSYEENAEKYRIQEASFKKLLAERFGDNTLPLYPQLTKLRNAEVESVITTSEKLNNIFTEPLLVYVDASGNIKSFYLSEKELLTATSVSFTADTGLSIKIDEPIFAAMIDTHVKRLGFLTKHSVTTPKVQEEFLRILEDRTKGAGTYALRIGLDDGPNTTGSQADKYIEVDISQQRMYLFTGGVMTKSYRVSTGSEYPTPVGQFTILNKTGLGFTTIYNSWLPYWMGFAYSEELGAYFGIHEVPYTLVDGGKIQRSYTTNAPNTGGCVALSPGDAVQVYRFADIGTPVYIFE